MNEPASAMLSAVLRDLGVDDDEIARAAKDGTLTLLTVERMMAPAASMSGRSGDEPDERAG